MREYRPSFSSQCGASYFIHPFFSFINVSLCFKPYSSSFQLILIAWKPSWAPTTHHIAALTISPLHSVEMLAPELGPARRTHKAAYVEDVIQGHTGPIPRPRPLRSHHSGLGTGRDRVNPSQAGKPDPLSI